jgi:hypothetical protein
VVFFRAVRMEISTSACRARRDRRGFAKVSAVEERMGPPFTTITDLPLALYFRRQ